MTASTVFHALNALTAGFNIVWITQLVALRRRIHRYERFLDDRSQRLDRIASLHDQRSKVLDDRSAMINEAYESVLKGHGE